MKEVKTIKEAPANTNLKAGAFVTHEAFGEGIVVGFSSITGNPSMFFYKEESVICVGVESVVIS